MTCCVNYGETHDGELFDQFFFLEEFLFHVICCFPLNMAQLITRLRQALQIEDVVEYQLMADVLKILER